MIQMVYLRRLARGSRRDVSASTHPRQDVTRLGDEVIIKYHSVLSLIAWEFGNAGSMSLT